ncbi:MAG TPA: ABC transporter permease [Gaiellaceae bacterium]|nr:ABC transporter permease [Gaiellaceae bacterium]
MRLALVYARAMTLELLRYPSFSVPTLAFPSVFFLLFVTSRGDRNATLLVASFAGFAVLAVAFFQFGVGIAAERDSPWERYLRTLPVRTSVRFGARVLSGAAFGLASAVLVAVTGVATTDAHLSGTRWAALALALVLGAVPFGLLGIALGYWASPRGALPAANVLYLVLSFAGGLWTTPAHLPSGLVSASAWIPTRRFGNVLWGAAQGDLWRPRDWALLLAWTAGFGALAAWGYARDEGRRYR